MSLRALGGGELDGDRLVRIVYLDEAGTSSRAQEPYLVVGGVIVHGDHQLEKLEEELESIVERHVPIQYRDGLVLHTSDIYGGNGKVFDKRTHPEWTPEKRMAILADLAKLPEKLNLWITFGYIKKETFPAEELLPGVDATAAAHLCAFVVCAIEIEHWMRQNAHKEHCLMIIEDTPRAKQLIKNTQRQYQDRKLIESWGEEFKDFIQLKKIKEDPAFQGKRPSHPLVLADFVSFVMKRVLMNDSWIYPYYAPWRARLAMSKVKLPQ